MTEDEIQKLISRKRNNSKQDSRDQSVKTLYSLIYRKQKILKQEMDDDIKKESDVSTSLNGKSCEHLERMSKCWLPFYTVLYGENEELGIQKRFVSSRFLSSRVCFVLLITVLHNASVSFHQCLYTLDANIFGVFAFVVSLKMFLYPDQGYQSREGVDHDHAATCAIRIFRRNHFCGIIDILRGHLRFNKSLKSIKLC